jgi:hypothetical protein
MRYSNSDGSSNSRNCDVTINGTLFHNYKFPITGSWSTFIYGREVTVYLAAGNNTVRVTINNTVNSSPKVDEMEIVTVDTPTYQAELATSSSNTAANANTGYTGTGYLNVAAAATANGQFLEFTNFYSPVSRQNVKLNMRYAANDAFGRACDLKVNGALINNFAFANTTAWTTWLVQTATINLNAGMNTIRLETNNTNSGKGPNIDKFELGSAENDHFRSATSGNWSNLASWQSSYNNQIWATSDLVPNSTASAVTVLAGHEVTVTAAASASTLTADGGAKITVATEQTLALTNLTLKSDATNGTATIKPEGTGALTITNPPTVEQYLTAGRNWFFASPVTEATSNVFAANVSNPVYYYVETVPNLWSQITNTSTSLTVGKGYVANINTDRIVSFTGGSLNTGEKTIGSLSSGGASFTGFNLVGNPYPSYLSWNGASRTNVGTTIWYRSKSTGSYLFQTYNQAGGGSTNNGTNLIPPMQAFWVKVTAGATGSIVFDNDDRAHNNQTVLTNRLKAPAEDTRKWLRLEVSNGINADEALIYADANAQNDFDTYDSNKMFVNNAAVPEIYTVLGTEKLAINGFNEIADNQQIALGFKTSVTESSSFSIKATEVKNFAAGTKIILKDITRSEEEFDITDGTAYNFTSEAANDLSRFSLLFRAPGSTTGIEKAEKLNAQVFVNASNQITISAPVKSNYAIYNALGQLIENGSLNSELYTIHYKLNSGMYVVKVSENGKELTSRVIIK